VLSPGHRLGPYEILARIGGGGMGEVYRARDPRLGRDVAVKVLRASLALTAERVQQLGREARAAGSLNHPNIVTVFDVATDGDVPYVVTELLEGESLRERLAGGALPFRKAVEYGIQIAEALGAAHEKGIVHRDVKPENAFVTREGRVKLLDFGLAKLRESEPAAGPEDETTEDRTSGVRGTAGYMSPEQVTGSPIDPRTDIFSLGAVLFEMFTGVQPFQRPSRVERMTAVLRDEPPDPLELNPAMHPAAVVALRRCLEKGREQRFQSARDLAFHLRQLQEGVGDRGGARSPAGRLLRRLAVPLLAVLALALAVLLVRANLAAPRLPAFERISFGRGRVGGARFATDSGDVIYSMARDGGLSRVFKVDSEGTETVERFAAGTEVLAIDRGGYLISLEHHPTKGERAGGRLASTGGGSEPRTLSLSALVEAADWGPRDEAQGGKERQELVAAAFTTGLSGDSWLEYPLGREIYRLHRGSIASPRFSRDGRRIAFIEDPGGLGLGGRVAVFDRDTGRTTQLTDEWTNARGLAWSADGREVWFAAGERYGNRALRAVDLKGHERVVHEAPASLTLWDVAPDGRVLFAREEERKAIFGVVGADETPRDLSFQDRSGVADLSGDGQKILFADRGGVYLRTPPAAPTLLGLSGGFADAIAPSGARVLATSQDRTRLMIVSVDDSRTQVLPAHGITTYDGAFWFPDGMRVVFNGWEGGRTVRAYEQDLEGGAPRTLTPEGVKAMAVSPDGRWLAVTGTGSVSVLDLADASLHPIRSSRDGDRPVAWSPDGRWLWVFRRGIMPASVFRLSVRGEAREPWKTLAPPDPAGVYALSEFHVTPSGERYVYSYLRVLSELYVARGLR
jgi:eukaryotic-like serine/threonine-protein kinase